MDLLNWMKEECKKQNLELGMSFPNFSKDEIEKIQKLKDDNDKLISFTSVVASDIDEETGEFYEPHNIIHVFKNIDKIINNDVVIGNIHSSEERSYISIPTSLVTDAGKALGDYEIPFDGPYNNLDDLVVSETINSALNKRLNKDNIEIDILKGEMDYDK